MKTSKVTLKRGHGGRSGRGVLRAGEKSPEFILSITDGERAVHAAELVDAEQLVLKRVQRGQLPREDVRDVLEMLGVLDYVKGRPPKWRAPTVAERAAQSDVAGSPIPSPRETPAEPPAPAQRPAIATPEAPARLPTPPWTDSHPSPEGKRPNWRPVARELREHPEEWRNLQLPRTYLELSDLVRTIRQGLTSTWAPAGAFEAHKVGLSVRARYVGDGSEPVMPKRGANGRFQSVDPLVEAFNDYAEARGQEAS